MFAKKLEFSTNKPVQEILNIIDSKIIGEHILNRKKIEPNYIGTIFNNGFSLISSDVFRIGNNIFEAKFMKTELNTNVKAKIQPSFGTSIGYLFIIIILIIGIILNDTIINFGSLATLFLLFSIPILLLYINLKVDVNKAKIFLADILSETKE